jgi:hypothetical protein
MSARDQVSGAVLLISKVTGPLTVVNSPGKRLAPLTVFIAETELGSPMYTIVATPATIPVFMSSNGPTDPEAVNTIVPARAAGPARLMSVKATARRSDRLFIIPPVGYPLLQRVTIVRAYLTVVNKEKLSIS